MANSVSTVPYECSKTVKPMNLGTGVLLYRIRVMAGLLGLSTLATVAVMGEVPAEGAPKELGR
jgi:hypothetical protein